MSISTRSSVIFPFERSPAHRGKDLMAKYLLEVFQLKHRRHAESRRGGTVSIKAAVRTQNMEVRMPPEEIAKRVYGDNGSRNRVLFRDGFLRPAHISFQRETATADLHP
jgi:hypothetical protein